MRPAILIPALNPDERLLRLAQDLVQSGFPDIIVVNDGSDEQCASLFEALRELGCSVHIHAVNMGKGRALKTGMNAYLTQYPNGCGVITADADGQHSAKDIALIASAMEQWPDKLILGARDFSNANVPFKSRAGNKITRSLFGYLSGLKLADTQTGLRGIPASSMGWMLTMKGERFEYEMNMLIECRRHEISIVEVPIETIYIDENASSHFNPLLDALRIYATLGKFAMSSVGSAVFDLALFALITKLLLPPTFLESIAVATVAARICSSLFNYTLNRNVVFGGTHRRGTIVRYYVLAFFQMLCSLFLVRWLAPTLGWDPVPVKFLVDMCLFIISFKIQQRWVFPNRTGGRVIRLLERE